MAVENHCQTQKHALLQERKNNVAFNEKIFYKYCYFLLFSINALITYKFMCCSKFTASDMFGNK